MGYYTTLQGHGDENVTIGTLHFPPRRTYSFTIEKTGVMMIKMRRFAMLIAVSAVTLGAGLLLIGCGSGKAAPPNKTISEQRQPVEVQSVAAGQGLLSASHAASGTIVPVTQSDVAARVSGVVETVVHDAGTWVKSGEIVVQLDDSQVKLSVQSAQAAVETAKVNVQKAKAQSDLVQLNLQRDQSLLKKSLIPQSQVDTETTNAESANQDYLAAQASLDQATAALNQSSLNLEYTSIRAPFAGQLAAVNAKPGEFVGQNTPAFVLVSQDREISFNVPPDDAAVFTDGSAVNFSFGGKNYLAHVSQPPSAPISGVVPIVAVLADQQHAPPYGSVGKITYAVTIGNGIIVPISAVQTAGDQDYLFEIQNGKSVKQNITIVAESGTSAAVEGVAPGALVIINPPPGLLEGSPVKSVATGNTNG
jgi:HlyD family secretion protein